MLNPAWGRKIVVREGVPGGDGIGAMEELDVQVPRSRGKRA